MPVLEAKSASDAAVARPALVRAAGKDPLPLSKILVNGLVAITPELAHRVILECGYDRQRGVRSLHVSALAMQMRRKEWTPGTQIHFARMPDGWLRLIDGQHRLHAVIEANTTVEFQLLTTDCKTEEEIRRLYRRHDRLAVRRTVEDMMRSEGLPEAHGLSAYVARGVFNAALIIASGFSFSHRTAKADPYLYRSDEARLRLCEPFWVFAEHYAEAISGAQNRIRKHFVSGPIMAVGLITLRDQEAKADAFWRGIANNDGLLRDDPRATYLRHLNVPRGLLSGFNAAKAASIAWNAFYDGRKPEYIRVVDTPIRLAGCDIEN